jgi:uncharacterized OB-fold protein
MSDKIAIDWRLKGPRYRLEGTVCNVCGTSHFPPRAICLECGCPTDTPRQESIELEVPCREEALVGA